MRTHGRIATYVHGCRCAECRRACADSTRKARAQRYAARTPRPGDQICIRCWQSFDPRGFTNHEKACLP